MPILKGKKQAAIFFDIEKSCDKVNTWRTFEQLENMGIQGQILETIKKLVKKRWIRLIEMSNKLHLGEN